MHLQVLISPDHLSLVYVLEYDICLQKDVVLYVIGPSKSANVIRKVNNGPDRIFAAGRFSPYEAICRIDRKVASFLVHFSFKN